MKRVLAFGCHPDDVEFQCAGTLALLAQKGYEIHIAVMAGGDMGSPDLSRQQIREIRLKENEASAAVINATFHFAGGQDVEVEYNSEYRKMAVKVFRDVDPFLVFTNPPTDYMIDHEETSRIVRNACFIAPIPNYDCGVPTKPTSGVPHLYYFNALGGKDIFGRPLPLTGAVDISGVMDVKEKMLACHASQRDWLKHHHHMDQYIIAMQESAARQGAVIGRPAAESYVQHRGSEYPSDDILAEILGDIYVKLG